MPELLFYFLALVSSFALITVILYALVKKNLLNLEERNKALITSREINKIILEELDYHVVVQRIVDSIPSHLPFGTGVLAILDENKRTIRRIAASHTKEAQEAIKALHVPFSEIEISLNDPENLMAKAVREKKPFTTDDVYDVLRPVIDREEARNIQSIMSTKTTLIYPIYMEAKVIGVFIASTGKSEKELTNYERDVITSFVDGAGIALQHAILYKKIKEQAEALKNANERLQELDHLKDEFVSLASHELRTPMTAIKSYIWMLLDKHMVHDAKGNEYLHHAYEAIDRLINLVNDMLNVSRIESGRLILTKETVSLSSLITDTVAEIKPVADKQNLRIEMTVPNDLPHVLADKNKIKEVIINLLGNALKFTPSGGTISVRAILRENNIRVEVQDTGSGIDKSDLPKLFTKFGMLKKSYRNNPNSQGTGLGLYICKSIIELHGGTINVASEGENKGTTFSFTLPKAS